MNESVSRADVLIYLDKQGFKHANRGFGYIVDAVMLATENPEIMEAITKELYPTIATMHDTTPSRVERAIRHSIESSDKVKDDMDSKLPNSEYIAKAKDDLLYGVEKC